MYVDGLLAENHGIELDGFDPLLRERTGNADTPYLEQPYWPTPESLPTGGTHLAYLDVWQREVTHLEDPDLVEIAVGVDATARRQTAWQVRLYPVATGTTCATVGDAIEGWLDLIRPSDGRLTTDTVAVEDEDDPCELPPGEGYRGLENQTYRVEIHEGGAPGTATFTWSRENASVALPVVEVISPTVLRLASVGKDNVLRISTGDWVEIIDDNFELDGELGAIRKVKVDDAERTIEFTDPLPAGLQLTTTDATALHLRVRRWDQKGVVRDAAGTELENLDTTGGVITVPAASTTQIQLEHGIVVSFSVAPTGDRFRRGDHWIFAARTADASIELLDDAPPLGVHHHYARLAVVTFPDTEINCRRLWPPLPTDSGDGDGECCDCTICVTPESQSSGALTLQAAVDQIKATGGTVCLSAGIYDIGSGIEVDGARSVRIRGQGPATILVARGEALAITSSIAVTVENLAIVSGVGAPAAVRLRGVALVDLHELAVLSFGSQESGGSAIELSGVGLLVALRRNVLVARTGIGVPGAERIGMYAAALRIEDNVVVSSDRGIDLGGASAYLYDSRVSRNDVLGPQAAGIVATGAVAPGGSLDLTDNKISTRGAGILVGADGLVDGNTINTLGEGPGSEGIVVEAGPLTVQPGHVRITGNRIHDRSGIGIVLRTAVRTFMVKQNVLATVGLGIGIEEKGEAERVAIDNNEVFDVATAEGSSVFGVGIFVMRAMSAAVVGNTVARVGPGVVEGTQLAGIVALATPDIRISGNVVDEIGPQDGFAGQAYGIAVVGPFERASVSDNSVRFGPDRPGPGDGDWNALLIQSAGRGRSRIGSERVVVPVGDGAVVVNRGWAFVAAGRGDHVGLASNTLTGGGVQPACLVRVGGDVVAEGNQCLYLAREDPSAIVLGGSSIVASSNRVRGDKAMLILEVEENRFAAVGNLAAGGTHLGGPGNGLPSPWKPLNPDVP